MTHVIDGHVVDCYINFNELPNLFFTKINFHWKQGLFTKKIYTMKIWSHTVLLGVLH